MRGLPGALPDGTPFGVSFDHGVRRFPDGMTAGIVMDVAGTPEAVGIVGFDFRAGTGTFYQDGVFVVAATAGSNGTGPNWDEIEVLVDSLP